MLRRTVKAERHFEHSPAHINGPAKAAGFSDYDVDCKFNIVSVTNRQDSSRNRRKKTDFVRAGVRGS